MKRIMIGSVSWIGDVIMCMPALQGFRTKNPDAYISILAKPGMDQLWALHAAPDAVLLQEKGTKGLWQTIQRIRKEHFDIAYILPHSFRSAFLPFMAGVKSRQGTEGHNRDWMLTVRKDVSVETASRHQAYEYFSLFDLPMPDQIPAPQLSIPEEIKRTLQEQLSAYPKPCIGFIPGAARGPSKQWPATHFIELGHMLLRQTKGTILLMGSKTEQTLCREIKAALNENVVDFSGKTSLAEWAGLLASCDAVVANDSGGMHLTAAVGAPVVALYGITDPSKTGPLGKKHVVLQHSKIRHRDVARDSEEARKQLASIEPRQVYEAVIPFL